MNADSDNNDANKNWVIDKAFENVPLVVHFARVDFVENLAASGQSRGQSVSNRWMRTNYG